MKKAIAAAALAATMATGVASANDVSTTEAALLGAGAAAVVGSEISIIGGHPVLVMGAITGIIIDETIDHLDGTKGSSNPNASVAEEFVVYVGDVAAAPFNMVVSWFE